MAKKDKKWVKWYLLIAIGVLLVFLINPLKGATVDNVISVEFTNPKPDGGCEFKILTSNGVVNYITPVCSVYVGIATPNPKLIVNDYSKKTQLTDTISFNWLFSEDSYNRKKYFGPGVSISGRAYKMPLYCGNFPCMAKLPECADGIYRDIPVSTSGAKCQRVTLLGTSQTHCTNIFGTKDTCSTIEPWDSASSIDMISIDSIVKINYELDFNPGTDGTKIPLPNMHITISPDYVKSQAQYSIPSTTTTTLVIYQTTSTLKATTTTLYNQPAQTTTTLYSSAPTTSTTLLDCPGCQPKKDIIGQILDAIQGLIRIILPNFTF